MQNITMSAEYNPKQINEMVNCETHTSRALIWTSCCIPHSAEALAVASKVLSLGIGSSVPESGSVLGTTEIIGGFESFEFVGKFIMAYQTKQSKKASYIAPDEMCFREK